MPVFQSFHIPTRTYEILFMCDSCNAEAHFSLSKAQVLAITGKPGQTRKNLARSITPVGWKWQLNTHNPDLFTETTATCPDCQQEQKP